MVAEVSHLPGSTGKGISELSLRAAGSFLQGREAGCATLHFWKSLSCKNYFPAQFFIRAGSIAASSTPQWPASVLFWGQNSPFSVPPRLEVFLCFSRSFLPHSEPEGCFYSGCAGCCLGAMQFPSKECCFGGFLPSQSLPPAPPSHWARMVWSIHCTSLMSQMQRAHHLFFSFFFKFFLSIFILHCGRFWTKSWDMSVHELCWELHRHIRKTIQYFWSVRIPAGSVRSAAAIGGWNAETQGAKSVQYCILVVIFQPESW